MGQLRWAPRARGDEPRAPARRGGAHSRERRDGGRCGGASRPVPVRRAGCGLRTDMLDMADLVRRPATFSYMDGEEYVFMDNEDYTPYHLNKESIADQVQFFNENTDGIQVLIVSDVPVALDLPMSVELEVVETDPSIKGASATSRTKPATLSTGLVVQVPEYISTGEWIKINTEERKFQSRADKH